MRHAKAEPFAATDHARRLTDRGRAAARDVGRHLREQGLLPDFVLVSSAVRTRETWAAVEETAASAAQVSYDDAVFSGSADVVIESLQGVSADLSTVMFVGHNPTAAFLCHLLDDGDGDPAAMSELLHGFPPCAVAVLEVGVPWAELGPETGRIAGYHVGRS
jgi:phosphohistidine phosphatase